jgi:hypothetical protein
MADDNGTTTAAVVIETPTETTPSNGDANRAKAPSTAPPPAEPAPKGETATTAPAPPGEVFTKAQVEELLTKRLRAHEEDQQKKSDKAKKDAVAAALKEQGDWHALADAKAAEADEHARRVAELEPAVADATTRADRYRAALETHLASQRKGLPKHIVDLLDRLDVADQLEYIARHADALKAPEPPPPPKPTGTTPNRAAGTTAAGETTPQLPRPREPLARV